MCLFGRCWEFTHKENGQGLFFDPAEYADIEDTNVAQVSETKEAEPAKKKPSLRILD